MHLSPNLTFILPPCLKCTALYFLADFLWVACVPICVKSPDLIMKVRNILEHYPIPGFLFGFSHASLQHHAVAGVLLFLPYFYPEYRWLTGIVLSVEINTWFLILRRVVYKSATPENPVNPVVGFTVSALFYSSWIIIRCVVYPAVLMKAFSLAKEVIEETGTWMHLPIVFIPFHAMLCVLNIKWTYDLFTPIVRQWMGTAPKTVGVSNGL